MFDTLSDLLSKLPPPPAPPVLPQALVDQLLLVDAELDLLHPGWRSPTREARRFDGPEFEEQRPRLKWLFKRQALLRQGRDWPVILAWKGRECFATHIDPTAGHRFDLSTTSAEERARLLPPVSPFSDREICEQRDRLQAARERAQIEASPAAIDAEIARLQALRGTL